LPTINIAKHNTLLGDFVVQDETEGQVSEALQVLRKWNPEWKPANFMTDFSVVEIHSIESGK
jgi:hypothetical protein